MLVISAELNTPCFFLRWKPALWFGTTENVNACINRTFPSAPLQRALTGFTVSRCFVFRRRLPDYLLLEPHTEVALEQQFNICQQLGWEQLPHTFSEGLAQTSRDRSGCDELARHLTTSSPSESSGAPDQNNFVEELRLSWSAAGLPSVATAQSQPHRQPHREQPLAQLKRRWPCQLCPIVCSTEFNLTSHMRRHATRKRHACPVCPTTCSTLFNLASHMRTHTGEKPFKCDMCPMAFAAKGTLVNHRRTHTGERPFQCPFCNKSFTRKFVLRDHISYRHSGLSGS
ncbi:uncharacterized protein LOC142592624 [Dermacentor variabilis]|uniref:uncharacterized protein LOC142592624 n=1 Tax=Dermacentor variabilis TaxID=34621 RepID=UPI003F5B5132